MSFSLAEEKFAKYLEEKRDANVQMGDNNPMGDYSDTEVDEMFRTCPCEGIGKEDAKACVIQKYSVDEARNLKSYGDFPESIKIGETVDFVKDLDGDADRHTSWHARQFHCRSRTSS